MAFGIDCVLVLDDRKENDPEFVTAEEFDRLFERVSNWSAGDPMMSEEP
jgi:hypothetical protein